MSSQPLPSPFSIAKLIHIRSAFKLSHCSSHKHLDVVISCVKSVSLNAKLASRTSNLLLQFLIYDVKKKEQFCSYTTIIMTKHGEEEEEEEATKVGHDFREKKSQMRGECRLSPSSTIKSETLGLIR